MEEDKQQPEAGWAFKTNTAPQVTNTTQSELPPPAAAKVSWTASEYVANPKSSNWFAMLAAATLVLTVIVYFVTHSIVSIVAILVLGIAVGVFAARQPVVLEYTLDESSLRMGQRTYPYADFKSFSVVADGAFSHISLLPLKRFLPPLAVHYAPEDEDKIIDTLSNHLPYEEHKRDLVESFSRKVRF